VLTEYEINSTFYVALGIDLVTNLSKESILIAIKTYTVVALLCAICRECNCLRSFTVGILDVYVVEFGVGSRILYRSSSLVVGSTTQKAGTMNYVDDIACVGRRIRRVAVDCKSSSSRRDNNLFRVRSGQDENTLRCGRSRAQRIYSFLNLFSSISAINGGTTRPYC